MNYPDNFDTPAFPAGPRIAISRFMAIASCIVFVLIIFTCIVLLWATRSRRIDPFIVSIDDLTGQWVVLDHSHGGGPIEYPVLWSLQQSVVANFAENWFTISTDAAENDAAWRTCERSESCGVGARAYNDRTCALYCASGEELFSHFIYDVVPDYQTRFSSGEKWIVDKLDIYFEPAGQISDVGGTWRISATVRSNISGDMDIVAFAKVARNTELYPQTLGYYVADFNAYRIN